MRIDDRGLLCVLEEGDVIRECDFAIYGQIGYEHAQLTPNLAMSRGMKERYVGKCWDKSMPEFFRLVGNNE